MKNKYIILLILVIATVLGYSSTAKINPDEYIVKAGDVFFIQTVFDTLTVRSAVLPAGSLSLLPFSDSVFVAGKTLTEAHRLIDNKLSGIVNREHIMVKLGTISPIRYHVLGAVIRPGEYTIPSLITLHRAIERAGGLSVRGSREVRILRNNNLLSFNLNDYLINNDLSANPLIMHDDIIMLNLADRYLTVFTNRDSVNFIETIEMFEDRVMINDILMQLTMRYARSNHDIFTVEREGQFKLVDGRFELELFDRLYIHTEELFVYVSGHVVNPGPIAYNGNLPASFYLTQAGGIAHSGSNKRIYIQRSDGERERYIGQSVQPGDIFFVPESFRSRFNSSLTPIATVVTMISTLFILANSM